MSIPHHILFLPEIKFAKVVLGPFSEVALQKVADTPQGIAMGVNRSDIPCLFPVVHLPRAVGKNPEESSVVPVKRVPKSSKLNKGDISQNRILGKMGNRIELSKSENYTFEPTC